MDPTLRFSERVEDYAACRPGYPPALIGLLKADCGLSRRSVIADVGSGTGKLTELLLPQCRTVHAVEPNVAMRLKAEELFSRRKGFRSVGARAEATTLPDSSVDIVTAGQAFHWFAQDEAAHEFRRILRADGSIVLVWNERDAVDSEYLREYESFVTKYSVDYRETNRRGVLEPEVFRRFFCGEYSVREFPNPFSVDFQGLVGGYLSASYALTRAHPRFPEASAVLHEIFQRYARDGRLIVPYRTRVIYSRVRTLPDPSPG